MLLARLSTTISLHQHQHHVQVSLSTQPCRYLQIMSTQDSNPRCEVVVHDQRYCHVHSLHLSHLQGPVVAQGPVPAELWVGERRARWKHFLHEAKTSKFTASAVRAPQSVCAIEPNALKTQQDRLGRGCSA